MKIVSRDNGVTVLEAPYKALLLEPAISTCTCVGESPLCAKYLLPPLEPLTYTQPQTPPINPVLYLAIRPLILGSPAATLVFNHEKCFPR